MDSKIIFEDDYILVINKPAGMVVNRADTTAKIETVQDWIERYLKVVQVEKVVKVAKALPETPRTVAGKREARAMTPPRWTENEDFYHRSGIIHRLDKETSGLLLIAKTPEAFVNLQQQFKNRIVKKKYLALVHGKVVPEEGEIKAPVGRLPWNRKRFGIVPGGKEAVTKYKVCFSGRVAKVGTKIFSFLELFPQTGRTHQIRVHLQFIGHPIVGDSFYAGRKQAAEDRKRCPRVFLHASGIEFLHPQTGKSIQFSSPPSGELSHFYRCAKLIHIGSGSDRTHR